MADKLVVKDFGPIRDAELEIKKTTVLIGPQGSGKSTLAKLVAIIKDKPEYNTETINNNFTKESINYGISNYGSSTTSVLYESWLAYFELKENTYNYLEHGIHKLVIFIPTERILLPLISRSIMSLLSKQIAIPNFLMSFGGKYERARLDIERLKIEYLDLEYYYQGDDYLIKKNKKIKLSESASGYQSIVPIKIVVEGFLPEEERSFIIEEPELNLYPTTQKSLIYYLADCCTKNKNELMMTTHSPYVLAALNNLIFAYRVAHEKPEKAAEVEKVIPRASWLNPDEFAAYYVADGTVRSIINPHTGLIAENELDSVSDEIGGEFNQLVDIYRSKTNETAH
jgi:predicted ATPase